MSSKNAHSLQLMISHPRGADLVCNGKPWSSIVQLDKILWLPSSLIGGISFVFMEEHIASSHLLDECLGMYNFHVLRYRSRIAKDGHSNEISEIPISLRPAPFPGHIKRFQSQWSLDCCEVIFNSLGHIRFEMQRILCRVAQSQGDFAVMHTKLQLPRCSWTYIKSFMMSRGIDCISGVRYSNPRAVLSWGLTYYSCRRVVFVEVLRFDTRNKMKIFRELFGGTSGFGVQKRRPKFSESRSELNINDVLNVICCRQDDNIDSVGFQRHGVLRDGIDLCYDESKGVLQLVLRYSKCVATLDSLRILELSNDMFLNTFCNANNKSDINDNEIEFIVPGMEFIDDSFVMRIQEVFKTTIHA